MVYQDPLLLPGYLKKVVQNLPGKVKHEHTNYTYNADSDTFENEINDFFKYSEVMVQLQEYQKSYEKAFTVNYNAGDENYKKQHVTSLLDKLESTDTELRLNSCRHLVYVTLGCFTTDKSERLQNLIRNNYLLIQLGAFSVCYEKLQQLCNKLFEDSPKNQVEICTEIDLYLTILYISLEIQRSRSKNEGFKKEFLTLEPNMTEYLLILISKLRDKLSDQLFPVKKVVLLLWKALLFTSSGQEGIKQSVEKKRKEFGLLKKKKVNGKLFTPKSTPQDTYNFENEITDRYPGYEALAAPFNLPCGLEIDTSIAPTKLLGYAKATENVELLYETLFPPKPSSSNSNTTNGILIANEKQNSQQQDFSIGLNPEYLALALPLTNNAFKIPKSISEAGETYMSNVYFSLANYQVMKERSINTRMWTERQKNNDVSSKNLETEEGSKDGDTIDSIEQIYARTIPHFQNIVFVLLKLLLNSMNISSQAKSNDKTEDSPFDKESFDVKENIEHAKVKGDAVRDKEIIAKSVSGILLILLKWSKSSHILKFEYLSQLLVDSGYLLLILKIIGLQNVIDLVEAPTDIPHYNFLECNWNTEEDKSSFTCSNELYTNRRNMYWVINYLRILQMLTKNKPHRVMMLAQYKSPAILKRLLTISHPVLELYTLKLLKNQLPYLGKKWKTQNMKVVSAIYLNCTTTLKDDWISKNYTEEDVEEKRMQERDMRILTQIYNGRNYQPSLMPMSDETDSDTTNLHFIRSISSSNVSEESDITLEKEFIENYETWLEDEVYKFEETDEVTSRVYGIDTPAPMTPCPEFGETGGPSTLFSHEQLTCEMNKLYVEQFNEEFNKFTPVTPMAIAKDEIKGSEWKSPPTPKKLTPLARYTGDESDLIYFKRDRDSKKNISIQDIKKNYMQIEDQLLQKLMQVEDNTIREWLNKKSSDEKVGGYQFQMLDNVLVLEQP